jgi:hypothetical protein
MENLKFDKRSLHFSSSRDKLVAQGDDFSRAGTPAIEGQAIK